jgi:hypothetical protein
MPLPHLCILWSPLALDSQILPRSPAVQLLGKSLPGQLLHVLCVSHGSGNHRPEPQEGCRLVCTTRRVCFIMKTTILRKVVRDNLEWHSERILVD